jgi:prepilin peptidase dependent protein B
MRNRSFGHRGSSGFTLIELMVAIVVGLIIVLAVVAMFAAMLRSNSENLRFVRLNQDLRSVMTLITRDMRRAGFNQNALPNLLANLPNPNTGITIAVNVQGDPDSCILFRYDSPVVGDSPDYGFRWNSAAGTVEERGTADPGPACDDAGGWQVLSDPALLNITELSFTEDPARSPATVAGVSIREITVTLGGALRNDPTVFREISEVIKIRNEEL